MTILIVDDERMNLMLIKRLVDQLGHPVESFQDPLAALARLEQTPVSLLMTDYRMPQMDGVELVQRVREMPDRVDLPILMVTTADERNVRLKAFAAGVTDFVTKPIDPTELRARARALLRLSEAQNQLRDRASQLKQEVDRATAALAAREAEIINRLARAADSRDNVTGRHIQRVAAYAGLIATRLGLPPDLIRLITLATPLHDVGKIGVPDHILLKPGLLTAEERAIIELHAGRGADILGGSNWELLRIAADIAGAHHERWDGTGYPLGLAGTDIPLSSRIVAVADVFDALVTQRPYKQRWSMQRARDYIVEQSGRHFDPDCVAAFEATWPDIHAVATDLADETPLSAAELAHSPH